MPANLLEDRQADSMIRQLNTMESPEAVRRVGVAARKHYESLTGESKPEPKAKRLSGPMWLYANLSPFLVSFLIMIPVIYILGRSFIVKSGTVILGQGACPPLCGWVDIGLWIAAGAIGVIGTLVLGVTIRQAIMRGD